MAEEQYYFSYFAKIRYRPNVPVIVVVFQDITNNIFMRRAWLLPVLFFCFHFAFAQEGSFTDHGFIPDAVHVSAEFQSMIYNDGYVLVATSDGIWKNQLETKEWSRSGLEGRDISAIYRHPEIAGRFFAGAYSDGTDTSRTLYISEDGGATWVAAEAGLYDDENDVYENYVSFAARPGNPQHIYANTDGGATIAVSKDGGGHWARMNYLSSGYFGYQSCIAFIPGDQTHIFQGSENPLDDAWLGSYDIDDADPVLLDNYIRLVGIETWSNRRPTQLQAHNYTGKNLYIGNEGALSKVTGSTHKFIYKSDGEADKPYSYIYGIWVDPADTNHLLFGGSLNSATQPMQLYETHDEGITFHRFADMFDLANPQVCEIIDTDPYPAILLDDVSADKVKLIVYKPDGTGIAGGHIPDGYIIINPVPVHNELSIAYSPAFKFKKLSLSLINSNGQILWTQDAGTINKIDMTGYAPGVYYLRFNADGRTTGKKIIRL